MADRYWVAGGTNLWSNTSNWSASPTLTPTGASVPTTSDSVFFTQTGSYTVNITSAAACLDFNHTAGTYAFPITTTITLTIAGNFTLLSTGSFSSTGTGAITFNGSSNRIINSASTRVSVAVNLSDSVTTTLMNDFYMDESTNASTARFLFNGGATLDLNNYSLRCGIFQYTGSGSIAFGTSGNIRIICSINTVSGSAVLNFISFTSFSYTGTSSFLVDGIGNTTNFSPSINLNGLSSTNAVSVTSPTGPNSGNALTVSGSFLDFNFNLYTGNISIGSMNIYGNFAIGSVTNSGSSSSITFASTSGIKTIKSPSGSSFSNTTTFTFNGVAWQLLSNFTTGTGNTTTLINGTIDTNGFSMSGAGSLVFSNGTFSLGSPSATSTGTFSTFSITNSSVTLLGNITVNSAAAMQFNSGTLFLNNYNLSGASFTSSNSSSRTINFGSTGQITISGASSAWSTSNVTNLTILGTSNVYLTNSTAVATNILSGPLSEANAISFNITAGTYALNFLNTSGHTAKNINFTGFTGTWSARTIASTVYGSITLGTGGFSSAASTGVITLGATSGTQIITSNAKAFNTPITVNGSGGTVQLADALNMGSTALTLVTGTFDGNSKTITGASAFSTNTGPVTMKGVSTALAFTHTSGTLTQGGANTVAAYAFTAGTLDLSSYQLNATTFTSSNSNTRTIAFGTGNITLNGTGAVWNTFTTTGFATTGTQIVNVANATATATSIAPGPLSEANSISFNITTGSYALTSLSNSNNFKSLNFQGFTGTAPISGTTGSVYKDLNLGSTISSFGTSGTTVNFIGTTTQTVTSSGKTFNSKIIVNNVGGTVLLADALTQVSTVDFALQSGTLDLNGKTLTVGAVVNGFATYLTGTKSITFNGGTLVCPFAGVAFNNAVPTGFTTTAGTGTGKISFTAATAKSFTGGGSTYNCTISNDGAGALTVGGNNTLDTLTTTSGNIITTGSNTINTITTAVRPVTFTFASSTTQTINNWNLSGISGSLVTIISSVAGTAATLSKPNGIVSADYLSLKDSAATGGASWYAGTHSTNVSGNSGWIFGAPSTFIVMF